MTLEQMLAAAVNPVGTAQMVRGDWDFNPKLAANGALAQARPERLAEAAVLVPVVSRRQPTLLLTRRTDTMRSHAGQVAFPGGKIDPDDNGPIAAALREAHEEVAMPTDAVNVLGITDVYETGSGFSITPVIGIIPPDLPLVPSAHEVAEVFEVPLDWLFDPANRQLREVEWQGHVRRYYSMDWHGQHIWGATAAMIVNLARRLG
jgi:8-oxo-dGTP pyrophosphatase MutT (NUDIX family)